MLKEDARFYTIVGFISLFIGEASSIHKMLAASDWGATTTDWMVAIFLAGPLLSLLVFGVLAIVATILSE